MILMEFAGQYIQLCDRREPLEATASELPSELLFRKHH